MNPFRTDKEDRSFKQAPKGQDAPHSRPAAQPLAEGEKPDQLAEKAGKAAEKDEDRQEALLDEAIEETFPGSDPISPKHIT